MQTCTLNLPSSLPSIPLEPVFPGFLPLPLYWSSSLRFTLARSPDTLLNLSAVYDLNLIINFRIFLETIKNKISHNPKQLINILMYRLIFFLDSFFQRLILFIMYKNIVSYLFHLIKAFFVLLYNFHICYFNDYIIHSLNILFA